MSESEDIRAQLLTDFDSMVTRVFGNRFEEARAAGALSGLAMLFIRATTAGATDDDKAAFDEAMEGYYDRAPAAADN